NVVNFLSQFAFFEGDSVVESFVDPKTLPGLAIYALHFAKVKPEAIREAYKHMYLADLPGISI
ncbi:MAG: hypothetical protein NZL90_04325, partial [Aquificaceae bacterium]|nr:hypothetical protein [Aquificaceae bacterium]